MRRCGSASEGRSGGKTALVAALCRTLRDQLSSSRGNQRHLHHRDADFLQTNGVLPEEGIRAVRTGCCPTYRYPRTSLPTSTRWRTHCPPSPAPGTGGKRWRQPHRHLQLRTDRHADLRSGCRRWRLGGGIRGCRVIERAVEDSDGPPGEVNPVTVDGGVHQPGTGGGLQAGELVPAEAV